MINFSGFVRDSDPQFTLGFKFKTIILRLFVCFHSPDTLVMELGTQERPDKRSSHLKLATRIQKKSIKKPTTRGKPLN